MKPPSGGPITGPSSAGIDRNAKARTRSDLATVRSSTSRPTGTIIDPPMPCTMRDATSSGRLCASPHPAEPRVKTAIAQQNTGRAPNRSAIQPDSGMNTAKLRR